MNFEHITSPKFERKITPLGPGPDYEQFWSSVKSDPKNEGIDFSVGTNDVNFRHHFTDEAVTIADNMLETDKATSTDAIVEEIEQSGMYEKLQGLGIHIDRDSLKSLIESRR